MRPVAEHLAACLAGVAAMPAERVSVGSAAGRVCAADVVASGALPRFDNSAMDGFAVRSEDVSTAGEAPVDLPVDADVPAGAPPPAPLRPGAAVRVMTGAPLPPGADVVVPVERVTESGGPGESGGAGEAGWRVRIADAPPPGTFVRRVGDDVAAGALLVAAGTALTPRHVALLAAAGQAEVAVARRPRVAVLSTGSEVRPAGTLLEPGQLHDANGPALTAAARRTGADAVHLGVVPDDAEAVSDALREAAASADLVITSGGVSAGAYDVVKEVLRREGGVEFARVAMQPGMPQGFGVLGGRVPVFTLPGNPVSALVSFEVFVRPALRRMLGDTGPVHREREVVAGAGWDSPAGKRQFVRARLEGADGAAGLPRVFPVGGQKSHLVADLATASCLVVVPEDVQRVREGDRLRSILLE